MNETPDSDSNNKNGNQQSKAEQWFFFKKIYQVFTPYFVPAFGVMAVVTIGFYFGNNWRGAWFAGSIGLIFLFLFGVDTVRTHILRQLVKNTVYIVLCLAILFCLEIAYMNLFPTKSDQPAQQIVTSNDSIQMKKGQSRDSIASRQKRASQPKKTTTSKTDTTRIYAGPGSIVSLNQQGGITAGTVNINESRDRTIPEDKIPAVKEILKQYKGQTIILTSASSDGEATRLAESFETIFSECGWNINSRISFSHTPETFRPGIRVVIKNESFKDLGITVGSCLEKLGFHPQYYVGGDGNVEIVVGAKETTK